MSLHKVFHYHETNNHTENSKSRLVRYFMNWIICSVLL